jgi:nitrite reductase (NADH) small subunit
MSERQWLRITACENIPLREGRAAVAADLEIALFNLGDRFLAVASRCPHQGGPLADGIVAGASVVCPLHAWKIDLASGCVERPAGSAACITTYPTRVEAGVVMVELPVSAMYRRPKVPVELSRPAATGIAGPVP